MTTINRNHLRRTFLVTSFGLLPSFAASLLAQGGPGGPPPRGGAPATEDEANWLKYMREDEKLARDVYTRLFERWKLTIFDRIAQSEGRHFSSVGTLLARYGVADPAKDAVAGVFAEPRLTVLYAQLMAKGMTSVKDALEVGLLIEKTDIDDLETAMKAISKVDIKRVYTNLLNGSYNHQEAFETDLELLAVSQ